MNVKITNKEKIKILIADDLFQIMAKVLEREEKIDKDKEHMWVVGLAQNLRLIFIELATLGTINMTLAEPMEIFRVALIKGAPRIILVHNHPSGELQPSDADKQVTDRLIQVGKIVGVDVYDHLIITPKSFFSFEEMGLMEILRASMAFIPTYQQVAEAKKEAEKIGAMNHAKEVAKELKRRGLDNQDIADISKYPLEKVKKLRVKIKKN
ncbi:JAB domain-containing protein [Fulvivirgaceae bacterium BMA10]|uniref:JAB domain-containing protein n=1 Tax=Splendidivirga corallicola TaxID=3051826 RepID=A0ABT8KKH5_9BACT|nr:JAB domain-containing protein [Fulvivirgaceae bacterium BMA10]